MRRRIGQRIDDLEELDHGTRPAVSDDERQCVRIRRADVQKVNAKPVNLGSIPCEAIERPLAAPPVVARVPILQQAAKLLDRRALRPILDRFVLRPARVCQTSLQILERALRRAIGKRIDLAAGLCEDRPPIEHAGRDDGRCDAAF